MPPTRRRWEIDALRGLMLVLMTLTHLPTRLTDPLGQPFGYVSAAEGFVLLSGYMAGLVYGRLAWSQGFDAMRQAFQRRALRVYACHAGLLLFLFSVIAALGHGLDQPAVKNLLGYYLSNPVDAVIGGLLLIYQPPLLDILPLYVLFMLLSPWALALALRHGWGRVLALSLGVWALAQFGLAEHAYALAAQWIRMPVPYGETGAFDSFAWQLLWMAGLWLGASRHAPGARALRVPGAVVALALAVAVAGFGWRHLQGQAAFGADVALNLLFDKWRLGPLRLLNLAALAVLVVRFGPALAGWLPRLRSLETLGAASLAVFCAHVGLVLLVLALFGAQLDRPWAVDAPLLIGTLLGLMLAARLALRPGDRRPGPPRVSGSPAR